ncbi:hypothetical protein [Vulcanisaeta distributa]|uniref:hypothetical protein n=1 Tax=Vulcanisaeta distributa TaxID=164451 RepID=UPI000A62AFCA|nr:hypothetical protein [Vulcanisaeta distributa]
MRIISWNINGLRSIMRKGSLDKLLGMGNYDIVLLQEIRSSGDVPLTIMGARLRGIPISCREEGLRRCYDTHEDKAHLRY